MKNEYNKVRRFYAWVGFVTLILIVVGSIAMALGLFTITITL